MPGPRLVPGLRWDRLQKWEARTFGLVYIISGCIFSISTCFSALSSTRGSGKSVRRKRSLRLDVSGSKPRLVSATTGPLVGSFRVSNPERGGGGGLYVGDFHPSGCRCDAPAQAQASSSIYTAAGGGGAYIYHCIPCIIIFIIGVPEMFYYIFHFLKMLLYIS